MTQPPAGATRDFARAASIAMSATLLALWLFLFVAALRGIPLMTGDHAFFTPVIQQVALTGRLENPWILHMAGTKFNWHSWLYPEVMARLPWASDYFRIGAGMLLVALALVGGFAWLTLRPRPTLSGALLLPAILALALFQMRRFELLSSLILCAAIPLVFGSRPSSPAHRVTLAGILSLTALAQPTVGLYAAIGLSIATAVWARTWQGFVRHVAGYGLTSLAVVAGATELHPQLSFTEWVGALLVQAHVISASHFGSFAYYFATEPALFGKAAYLLALPLLGAWLWRYAARGEGRTWRLPILGALLGCASFVIWFTSVRLPGTSYNLLGLGPIVLFALHQLSLRQWPGRGMATLFIVAISALALLTLAHRALVTASGLQGMSRERFSAALRPLSHANMMVGASSQLIPYVAQVLPNTSLKTWPRAEFVDTPQGRSMASQPPPLLIVEQADSGNLAPREIAGFHLVLDKFSDAPTIMGWTYARTRKDFSFALYCRSDACGKFARAAAIAVPLAFAPVRANPPSPGHSLSTDRRRQIHSA